MRLLVILFRWMTALPGTENQPSSPHSEQRFSSSANFENNNKENKAK
jgi:hypothetical protein